MSQEGSAVRRTGLIPLVVAGVLLLGSCSGVVASSAGTNKAGGAPEKPPVGVSTLTFATADPLPVDTTFIALVSTLSDGHLRLQLKTDYSAWDPASDQHIARDLKAGRVQVADVGSRAWESLGALAFRAYQEPFLVSSQTLLDQATGGALATGLLATLKPIGITGLAIDPRSVRYLYSRRPLTTPAQFAGATVHVNASATTGEILADLGAKPDTTTRTEPQLVQALRAGTLTAVESDPAIAVENNYVSVAPYVTVNAPLFAKTATLAANAQALARLPKADLGWLREAAQQAVAADESEAGDRSAWVQGCAEGLKAETVTPAQFDALHTAEAPVFADLATDEATTLAAARVAALATREPRLDGWATCPGTAIGASTTPTLDGTYTTTISHADVTAGGDCGDCGNNGIYTITIRDGRYSILHPWPTDANRTEPAVSFFDSWQPDDPIDDGTLLVQGDHLELNGEIDQQYGNTPPEVYTFEHFRGSLTLHPVSGTVWEVWDAHPLRSVR